jgi:lysophospholipase L1-like esterase
MQFPSTQMLPAAALMFGLAIAPSTWADEKPAPSPAPVVAPVVAPPKDDPITPAPKGFDDKSKASFLARHEGFLKDKAAALANGPIQFVAVGDSITDGWRGVPKPEDPNPRGGKLVWDKTFGAYNPYNIGIGGDRTQHVLWRIDNGELDGITPNPKVAMLMIGTNNIGNPDDQAIANGVIKCVESIHSHLPATKILLLGIFPRSAKATDPARARIKHINEIIAKLDDGGKTVRYLDIGSKFLDANGDLPVDIMPDALHPNAKGYQIWADAVQPVVAEMMK